MKKIIVSEFISLDGVFEAPGPDGSGFKYEGWTLPYANDEFRKFKAEELFASDALLLGQVTYEGFAKAWPKAQGMGEFGERMNSMPKYVVSTTLQSVEWNNSTIIKENISQEITKLKQQSGQDILVCGSGALTQTLMQNNLVDEIRLLVYPIVLGSGKKFFKEGEEKKLELIESRAFSTGVVLLRYRPTA
jgi:dihydrofolate reductase